VTQRFEQLALWRQERQSQKMRGVTLGLVPTMGALHEGHAALVRRSREENDRTLVTIFVNPTQFEDQRDLAEYPRTLTADLALLTDLGADFVLLPLATDLFADGYRYRVTETTQSQTLEGACRPSHFDGVLTIVLKLLQIASAERAYFGEKDWQQLSLVRGMAAAFFVSTTIVPCVTVREPDGLAYSSRNARLTPADRAKAPRLYATIAAAASAEDSAAQLGAAGFVVDYVVDENGRRLAAARLGGVRLIDNVPVPEAQ